VLHLARQIWQKAKVAAMGEIPKILPKLRATYKKAAEKRAKAKARPSLLPNTRKPHLPRTPLAVAKIFPIC